MNEVESRRWKEGEEEKGTKLQTTGSYYVCSQTQILATYEY